MFSTEKTDWFCKKINKLKDDMFAISVCILKNRDDAEDAIQNTLLITYEHLDELKSPNKFKPWIIKILTRECYKIYNKKIYHLDIDEVNCADEKNFDIETKISLWNIIQSLNTNYRTVIMLFYFEDMSISDIANALDISEDNAKKRLSRARAALKKLISEDGII